MNNELKLLSYLNDEDSLEILVDIIVNRMRPDHTRTEDDNFINDIRNVISEDPNIREFMKDVEINENFIANFIINNEDEIREKYKQRQHSWLYSQLLQLAMNIKEQVQFTNFRKLSTIKNFLQNNFIAELSNDDIRDIYNRYSNNYELEHGRRPFSMPRIINVEQKMREYVANHEDLLTLEDFVRVSRGWTLPKNKTMEELYERYCELYNEKPGNNIQFSEVQRSGLLGYRGKEKRRWFNVDSSNEITNYFPLKSNIKRYQTHKISSRNSFIIDLMFEKRKFCYLVAININTRYLVVAPLNIEIESKDGVVRMTRAKKNITNFIRAMEKVMSEVEIRHLYGDSEPAFVSTEAKNYYRSQNIVWHDVPRMTITDYNTIRKSEPQHTSLGIVDRVIRTIRDMGWNMKAKIITPKVMEEIVKQYNSAPHKTLSLYAGFPVTPTMVQNDADLEEYITREIMKENYNITQSGKLRIGEKVKVYNVPDPMIKRRTMIVPGEHRVTKFKNGFYTVRDQKGNTQKVPRYRLSLL